MLLASSILCFCKLQECGVNMLPSFFLVGSWLCGRPPHIKDGSCHAESGRSCTQVAESACAIFLCKVLPVASSSSSDLLSADRDCCCEAWCLLLEGSSVVAAWMESYEKALPLKQQLLHHKANANMQNFHEHAKILESLVFNKISA